jgi:hypothetical protein
MDINDPKCELTQHQFKVLTYECKFKQDWKCSKTDVACKDYLCPFVKKAKTLSELCEMFLNQ